MIENDDLCIQKKAIEKKKEKETEKKPIDPEKKRKYNKIGYNNYKEKGGYRKYYEQNKEKIRDNNKKRYYSIKEKLEKLKLLEDENNNNKNI